MNICYVGDAASIHTQRWVRWFAVRYEVIVISTGVDSGLPEYKVATLPSKMKRGSRLVHSVREVRRVLAEHRPDILHCHYVNEAGWFGLASRWRPLVVTAWGSDIYRAPTESHIARFLNPLTLRRADHVTCDSQDQAAVIRSWGVAPGRVSVIGWGVDRTEFHPGVDGTALRDELDIPRGAPVVLSPRQWYANSNIPTVVAAHERLPDGTYLILKRSPGFEPDNGAGVLEAIEKSSAGERIRVVGMLESSALPSLYAAADVVVSICTTDGTPVSVLEAMAVGRPVVAFEIPSLAEWVAEPGGRLVRRMDAELIADALQSFLADTRAREQAAVHNVGIIATSADRDAEFERMAEIYERLHGVAQDTRSADVG